VRRLRQVGAVSAIVLLVAACSSSEPAEEGQRRGDGASRSGGSVQGITDDTIKLSVIAADFGVLEEQGLAPDLGDQPAVFRAMAEAVNADGGIAGRNLEVNVHIVEGVPSVDTAQAACLKATEEDRPFAVFIAAAILETAIRCVAVQKATPVLSTEGWSADLYEEADGRLFSAGSNISMGVERQFRAWARIADELGELDGKTIGVVVDQQEILNKGVDNGLVPELEELGHEVAVKTVLPCPEGSQTCAQHEAAVQRMKTGGVDYVFMTADVLAGVAFVRAAQNLDFHPDWAANRRQVTDTVAQFFESVKEEWDGALGVSSQFEDTSRENRACNQLLARAGLRYEEGSDAYNFSGVNCMSVQMLDEALSSIEGDITHESFIQAMEGLGEVPSNNGPPGRLGPNKHDAGDYVVVTRYKANEGVFVIEDDTSRKVR
jgi:ABC-type branched-subunit amino acid transport system substrate-binding protein